MTTWLQNQPKVRFVQKRLRNLDELIHEEYDFVINCTGVGARFLVDDTNIRPISGHVLSKMIYFCFPLTCSWHKESKLRIYESYFVMFFLEVELSIVIKIYKKMPLCLYVLYFNYKKYTLQLLKFMKTDL